MQQAFSALTRGDCPEQSPRSRAQRRRHDITDSRAFVAVRIDQLRCDRCGGSDVMAVEPGSAADEFADLFVVTRPAPTRAWCAACWPASFSAAVAA